MSRITVFPDADPQSTARLAQAGGQKGTSANHTAMWLDQNQACAHFSLAASGWKVAAVRNSARHRTGTLAARTAMELRAPKPRRRHPESPFLGPAALEVLVWIYHQRRRPFANMLSQNSRMAMRSPLCLLIPRLPVGVSCRHRVALRCRCSTSVSRAQFRPFAPKGRFFRHQQTDAAHPCLTKSHRMHRLGAGRGSGSRRRGPRNAENV